MTRIIEKFHQILDERLRGEITNRMVNLANGSASVPGMGLTISEKYVQQSSYIQALNEVLGLCDEISKTMHGGRDDQESE